MKTDRCLHVLIFVLLGIATCSAQLTSRYELDVKDFVELMVIDGINIDYKSNSDSVGKAVFYASSDIASVITFSNSSKQKLEIKLAETETPIEYKNIPTVTVYSKFLTKVTNRGDSTVRILSVSPGPSFKAQLEGNGRLVVRNIDTNIVEGSIFTGNGALVINGKCNSAKLNNKGVGSIQADGLDAETVKCVQIGTGYVGCSASKELTIYGASGKVYYNGTPMIKNRSIGIKVLPLDSEE